MATLEVTLLRSQLEERKKRLEQAIALTRRNGGLAGLLREVDSAPERMDKGTYGLGEAAEESARFRGRHEERHGKLLRSVSTTGE